MSATDIATGLIALSGGVLIFFGKKYIDYIEESRLNNSVLNEKMDNQKKATEEILDEIKQHTQQDNERFDSIGNKIEEIMSFNEDDFIEKIVKELKRAS